MKIYTDSPVYANWIPDSEIVSDLNEADLVIFTGGEDVDPELYGERIGKFTHTNLERDMKEMELFDAAVKMGIPVMGICRGSQFLTVMNNGHLIQHVSNHGISTTHAITTKQKEVYQITSTHHQMMFPYYLDRGDYEVIAWSTEQRSDTYLDGDDEEMVLPDNGVEIINIEYFFLEPEIVFYPKTKSLCIQGHPEYSQCPQNTRNYLVNLIKTKLFNENI